MQTPAELLPKVRLVAGAAHGLPASLLQLPLPLLQLLLWAAKGCSKLQTGRLGGRGMGRPTVSVPLCRREELPPRCTPAGQVAPAPPAKPVCAVTGLPAKYRDPKTGLPYANLEAYKMLQQRAAYGGAMGPPPLLSGAGPLPAGARALPPAAGLQHAGLAPAGLPVGGLAQPPGAVQPGVAPPGYAPPAPPGLQQQWPAGAAAAPGMYQPPPAQQLGVPGAQQQWQQAAPPVPGHPPMYAG